jgi:hypothetical protein
VAVAAVDFCPSLNSRNGEPHAYCQPPCRWTFYSRDSPPICGERLPEQPSSVINSAPAHDVSQVMPLPGLFQTIAQYRLPLPCHVHSEFLRPLGLAFRASWAQTPKDGLPGHCSRQTVPGENAACPPPPAVSDFQCLSVRRSPLGRHPQRVPSRRRYRGTGFSPCIAPNPNSAGTHRSTECPTRWRLSRRALLRPRGLRESGTARQREARSRMFPAISLTLLEGPHARSQALASGSNSYGRANSS